MKTEFLKELGLSQDVIDKVMAENGKDIAAEQAKTTAKAGELTTADQTIKDLKEAISKFDGVDVAKLKKDLKDLEQKYDDDMKGHKAELEKIAYNSASEKFVDSLNPKDSLSRSAILAEFAKKEFKRDGDSFQGAKEWAEAFKKEHVAHFADSEENTTSASSGGTHNTEQTTTQTGGKTPTEKIYSKVAALFESDGSSK